MLLYCLFKHTLLHHLQSLKHVRHVRVRVQNGLHALLSQKQFGNCIFTTDISLCSLFMLSSAVIASLSFFIILS